MLEDVQCRRFFNMFRLSTGTKRLSFPVLLLSPWHLTKSAPAHTNTFSTKPLSVLYFPSALHLTGWCSCILIYNIFLWIVWWLTALLMPVMFLQEQGFPSRSRPFRSTPTPQIVTAALRPLTPPPTPLVGWLWAVSHIVVWWKFIFKCLHL